MTSDQNAISYFKQDWRSRAKAEILQYVILKWTSALLIGLGTSLVAFFNNIELKLLLVMEVKKNPLKKNRVILPHMVTGGR
ncbi:chloride channel protein CLC-c [Trifolium repens]|nr:chloride channel protein CLC-c [Trifolium repens]